MDDLAGDTESQTEMSFLGAGLFCAVKPLKDLFFFCVRDTGAVVFHGNLRTFSITGKKQAHASAHGSITDSVMQQNSKYLGDALLVAGDGAQRGFRQRDGDGGDIK